MAQSDGPTKVTVQNPSIAVTAASLPLPAGAAQDGTDITSPTAMPAGGVGIRGWLSAIWTKLNGSIAVTGTFWQATQPVSLATNTPDVTDRAGRLLGHVTVDSAPAVTGSVSVSNFPATQPVSLATNAPDVTDRAARLLGHVTVDPAVRTSIVLSASGVASVAAVAFMSLNVYSAGTVTTATSYTVPVGKTLRIQALQLGVRFATPSTTVTFASTTFVVRYVTTGAVAVTSNILLQDSKLAASNVPVPNSDLAIPDGLDIPAGYTIGITHLASATTLLEDVALVGYLY